MEVVKGWYYQYDLALDIQKIKGSRNMVSDLEAL